MSGNRTKILNKNNKRYESEIKSSCSQSRLGVLCLELGSQKPDDFKEIYDKLLEYINCQKYYSITVHDIDWNVELNNPELIFGDGNKNIILRQITFDDNFQLSILEYYFYSDGNYFRWARNIDAISQLQSQIDELKAKSK